MGIGPFGTEDKMPKIEFPGMEQYTRQLERIGREAPRLCGRALYDGAAILADEVQAEINGLPLDPRDKQGLHDGLGVAHFWEENGAVVTKIGWQGYNTWRTKRWPQGKPNAMIARAQIRGTSWIRPNRFTTRAARKAREKCIQAMQRRFDRELQEITE